MKTYCLTISLILAAWSSFSQTVQQRLKSATDMLLKDEQMKHAMMSLYVVETKTGKVIYHLNEQTGLAAASTQKILTSVAAFDLLGKDYRYRTELGYDGIIEKGILKGNLYVVGYGDPTLGSWRFNQTNRDSILNSIYLSVKNAGIYKIEGDIIFDNSMFSYQPLPGGWIWDDIGNYYGAGTWGINWNENQYDLLLKPGNKEGDDVEATGTKPALENYQLTNLLKTGKSGSGDNGYIYMPPYSSTVFVTGTVPAGEKQFILSGALPNPAYQMGKELEKKFIRNKIEISGAIKINGSTVDSYRTLLTTIVSPSLDSIVYWFLQKSINLYGEALLKTMSYEKSGVGSTEKGVELLKDFWSKNGIEKSALNIADGSGLSPQNRVTTDALVKALQYAKTHDWYGFFYNALPLYNGMKIKSGTIGGAKAYAGYHTSKSSTEYTFAIIINNYDEAAGSIVPKMFKVLDELK
ncbi:MAG TPA: D-alanyl-D-alanine carboxypeptidase/D-alanyl-D-alanine-endopeptidase [Panacibacter sp.]|nr:D-alanyl-D-alanine carboxypeptidase/D-alanyl-D-alanine-endopeptidase [Panacibacter sp.]